MSNPRKRKFGADIPPEGAPSMVLDLFGVEYRVRGEMPGIRLLRIIDALEGADEEGIDVSMLISFIEDSFLAEDRERGMAALSDEKAVVPLPMLIEIVQWLVSEYTGNPTEQQSQSDTSSEKTGPTSSENPSSTGSISAVLTDTPSGQPEQHTPAEQS